MSRCTTRWTGHASRRCPAPCRCAADPLQLRPLRPLSSLLPPPAHPGPSGRLHTLAILGACSGMIDRVCHFCYGSVKPPVHTLSECFQHAALVSLRDASCVNLRSRVPSIDARLSVLLDIQVLVHALASRPTSSFGFSINRTLPTKIASRLFLTFLRQSCRPSPLLKKRSMTSWPNQAQT
ncbi:hypothetical protein DENSPDRAFT_517179 [Dentipellis sp. KUC8613]|nr:hypothetical protein DENSPDRAFT_517179 [Dentipellis sp. KUC8613]